MNAPQVIGKVSSYPRRWCCGACGRVVIANASEQLFAAMQIAHRELCEARRRCDDCGERYYGDTHRCVSCVRECCIGSAGVVHA